MSNPLTTVQAFERYACTQCKEHGSGACYTTDTPWDCVESSTCSLRCNNTACGERIWFEGSYSDNIGKFLCPYCGNEMEIGGYNYARY